MEETGRNFVKWTLAIIVLAGVVAYAVNEVGNAFRAGIAFGDDAEESTETGEDDGEAVEDATTEGPVAPGEATPEVDFAFTDNVVQASTSELMTIGPGPGDAVLLSFPLIPGDPSCVESVQITIGVPEASPTEIAAYPSALTEVSGLTDGIAAPVDPVIPIGEPPLAFTDGTPGALAWDVTGIYRTWVTGGTFGEVAAPPEGTSFNVVLKPTVPAQPDRRVILAASEATNPPYLRWTGLPDCPAPPPPSEPAPVEPAPVEPAPVEPVPAEPPPEEPPPPPDQG